MLIDPSSRRGHHLMVAGGVALLTLLLGLGAYGLLAGPRAAPSTPSGTGGPEGGAPPVSGSSAPTVADDPPGSVLPRLPHTDDPVVYAQSVAELLLAWDTMSPFEPRDHAQAVLGDADPGGLETSGLAADVVNYMPSSETWRQLREHQTAQTVTIEAAYVPASWDAIAASPAAERLRDGTMAVTVEATRHRTGVWLGEPAQAHHPTMFTVFLACPPAFDRCHTLRLSRLDEPLP